MNSTAWYRAYPINYISSFLFLTDSIRASLTIPSAIIEKIRIFLIDLYNAIVTNLYIHILMLESMYAINH